MRWLRLVAPLLLAGCTGEQGERNAPSGTDPDVTSLPVELRGGTGEEPAAAVRVRAIGPADAIPRQLVVRTSTAWIPKDLVGAPDADVLDWSIEPEVEGTLAATSQDEIVFTPANGLLPGTKYEVTVRGVGPKGARISGKTPWTLAFTTPDFGLIRLSPVSVDTKRAVAEVDAMFSGPVSVDDVRARAVFSLGGSPISPSAASPTDDPGRVRFTFRGTGKLFTEPLALSLEPGTALVGRPSVKAGRGEAEVQLSGGLPVEIRAVKVREGSDGFYVDVICDDAAAGNKRSWWDEEGGWDYYHLSERCMLDAQRASEWVRFDPALDFEVAQGSAGFRLFGAFERGDYKVTIDAGATSIDGGRVQSAFSGEFAVPGRSPSVAFATKGRYLPRDAWDELQVRHLNIDALEVEVRHVPAENLVFWAGAETERADARTSNLLVQTTVPVHNAADVETTSFVDVGALLPEVGTGLYEITVSGVQADEDEADTDTEETQDTGWRPSPPPKKVYRDASRILLTDMHLVAKVASPPPGSAIPTGVWVWALGVHDNRPVPGVDVSLVRPSGRAIATCKTGSDGGCNMPVLDDGVDKTPPFAIVAKRGDDLSYIEFADLEVALPDGTSGVPYATEEAYRAAAWTDRGVYRPGDVAHVAAIVRERDHGAPDAGLPVTVKLFDPRNKEVRRRTAQANAAGMLSVDLPFADFASTGHWRAELHVAEKKVGEVGFAVEEFVPERMRVTALTERAAYRTDEPVDVEVDARWLFGGVAGSEPFEVTCELRPSAFRPAKNGQLRYGLANVDTTPRPMPLGVVQGKLDESGAGSLTCPAPTRAGGFEGPGELVATAAVFEGGSGRSTLGVAKAPVHPERYYVGLDTGVVKGEKGKAIPVTGMVVDWQGEPVTDVAEVEIELVRLDERYSWSWDEDEHRSRYTRVLRRARESAQKVAVNAGKIDFTVTPSGDGAAYLVVARAGNARTELHVPGGARRYWWSPMESSVDQTPRPAKPSALVVTGPAEAKAGEQVEVSVQAPYRGRMLFTVETDTVLQTHWKDVEPGPVAWSFPVAEFTPNLYVSAFLMKDPHLESAQAFLPDRAFGATSVKIAPVAYTHPLTLTVPQEIRPRSTLDVIVDLGVQTETSYVAVAAIDEGILSLTDFEDPDPFATIFAKRALGVDSYETVGWTLMVPPSGPSSRTGGDAAGAGARVQMVKPVALWSGLVQVPPSGKAKVSFEVPGYQGALRVMAVSAGSQKMGRASAPVVVKDPLVVQPTLPRFLVDGDEADVPVFVSNVSGKDREVEVTLAAEDLDPVEGLASPVEVLGAVTQRMKLANGASDTVVFRVRARRGPGAAKLRVTAKGGDISSWDELEIPIAPSQPEARLTSYVAMAEGTNAIPVEGWVDGARTTVWATRNPYGAAFSHLRYMVRYPYGCVEQTTTSTRPLLHVRNLVENIDPSLMKEKKVDDMVQSGIRRLVSMQTPSGGLAYWPGGSQPTPWGTVYATHLWLDAKNAGYEVPESALDDALDYLEREVGRGGDVREDAYAHYVLALGGRGRPAQAQALLDQAGSSRDEDRFLLMAAMYKAGDRRHEQRLKQLDTSELTWKRENDWTFWSDLRSRGMRLSIFHDLFGNAPEGEKLAEVVGGGLGKRPSWWYTTQEMGWGITGLGKWIGTSEDIKGVTARVDGKPASVASKQAWSVANSGRRQIELTVPKGSGRVYAVVTTEGVRQVPDLATGGEGLAVTREWLADDGTPVTGPIDLGTAVFERITIKNTSGREHQNLALVDRLPAGLEIENPRLGRGMLPEWLDADDAWALDHMNLRDDRIEVFGTLQSGEQREIVYRVRAVTAGTFHTPQISAEAMYDPMVWARENGGTLTVRPPWGGT